MPYASPTGGEAMTIPRKMSTSTPKGQIRDTRNRKPRSRSVVQAGTPLTAISSNTSVVSGTSSKLGESSGSRSGSAIADDDEESTGSGDKTIIADDNSNSDTQQPNQVEEVTEKLQETLISDPAQPSSKVVDNSTPDHPSEKTGENRRDSTPSLSSQAATSASSLSVASLSDGGDMTSPATSAMSDQPILVATERDDELSRYKRWLYGYTRGLYLEARISKEKAELERQEAANPTGFAQFGAKQSGMEKLAKKKALAKQLGRATGFDD